MAMPGTDEVRSWGGKVAVDRTGAPIGSITQIYTDDDTGLPEWATVQLGEATVFLPLVNAVERDGQVRVSVRRDDVAKAPMVGDRQHITADEEERLYRYYGIPYSPSVSSTVLPAGEGPGPSAVRGAVAVATGSRARLLATGSAAALTALLVTVGLVLRGRRRSAPRTPPGAPARTRKPGRAARAEGVERVAAAVGRARAARPADPAGGLTALAAAREARAAARRARDAAGSARAAAEAARTSAGPAGVTEVVVVDDRPGSRRWWRRRVA